MTQIRDGTHVLNATSQAEDWIFSLQDKKNHCLEAIVNIAAKAFAPVYTIVLAFTLHASAHQANAIHTYLLWKNKRLFSRDKNAVETDAAVRPGGLSGCWHVSINAFTPGMRDTPRGV